MGVAMHDKPAVPFRIGAGLIKMMGFKGQAPHQRPMGFLNHPAHPLKRIAIMPDAGPAKVRDKTRVQPLHHPTSNGPLALPDRVRSLRRPWSCLLLALLGLTSTPLISPLRAAPLPHADGSEAPRRCPALLPSYESFLEPIPLRPKDVPAKNAKGCLSPADAIYGPDGCPKKLCPQPKGLGL